LFSESLYAGRVGMKEGAKNDSGTGGTADPAGGGGTGAGAKKGVTDRLVERALARSREDRATGVLLAGVAIAAVVIAILADKKQVELLFAGLAVLVALLGEIEALRQGGPVWLLARIARAWLRRSLKAERALDTERESAEPERRAEIDQELERLWEVRLKRIDRTRYQRDFILATCGVLAGLAAIACVVGAVFRADEAGVVLAIVGLGVLIVLPGIAWLAQAAAQMQTTSLDLPELLQGVEELASDTKFRPRWFLFLIGTLAGAVFAVTKLPG
jgi:uncharacterized membrane protein